MRKEDDDFVHLAHIIDDKGEAGYFVMFNKSKEGELITSAEGLLSIKATSAQNQRFADTFKNKPQTEDYILEYIKTYQFAEDDHINRYNEPQKKAIDLLVTKMQEYGTSVDEIEKVYHCILHSKSAYINRQSMNLVRLVNRLLRQQKHIGDDIIKQFISLSHQYVSDEKTDKAPLSEIVQIFA